MTDSATLALLATGSFGVANFVTIFARDGTVCGFWDRPENQSVSVISPVTGAGSARNFVGGLISVDPIPYVIGVSARAIGFSLSAIKSDVQDMLHGLDVRHVSAEIHRGYFDLSTGNLVASPIPKFLGRLDTAPLRRPPVGQQGSVSAQIVSTGIDLTQINPAKSSLEQGDLRHAGDTFLAYGSIIAAVQVTWGGQKKVKKG